MLEEDDESILYGQVGIWRRVNKKRRILKVINSETEMNRALMRHNDFMVTQYKIFEKKAGRRKAKEMVYALTDRRSWSENWKLWKVE